MHLQNLERFFLLFCWEALGGVGFSLLIFISCSEESELLEILADSVLVFGLLFLNDFSLDSSSFDGDVVFFERSRSTFSWELFDFLSVSISASSKSGASIVTYEKRNSTNYYLSSSS